MFLSYDRFLLRSFGIQQLRVDLRQKYVRFFQGKLFQGKRFQGNFFQGKLFQGKLFQGKLFQGNSEMRLPISCASDGEYDATSFPCPP